MSTIEEIRKDEYLSGTYDWMMKKYGNDKLARFLTVRIHGAIRKAGDTCMDNFRVARKDDDEAMVRYRKTKDEGC